MTEQHDTQKIIDGQTVEHAPEALAKEDELAVKVEDSSADKYAITEKEAKYGVRLLTDEAIDGTRRNGHIQPVQSVQPTEAFGQPAYFNCIHCDHSFVFCEIGKCGRVAPAG